MTRTALLAQIVDAFGPEGPLDVLAQDLATAQARHFAKPLPAALVAYVHPGRDPAEFLFGGYRFSLPWLEPAQLQRHLGTLLRLSLEDRDPPILFERLRGLLSYVLAPEAPPSVRAHYQALLAPLTVAQRAAIAAVVRATASSEPTIAAWTRVVAHDASGAPGPWYDVLWPQPLVPDVETLIALWQDAFPGDATEPLPDLSPEAEVPFYLPFVSQARMESLLPRFVTFVLREPEHAATPAVIRQLHALFQPFAEPDGAPLLRERLAGLSSAQRRAVHGLVCHAFPADDLLMLWAQAAALEGPDWLQRLTRPEWDPDSTRSLWLESMRGAMGSTAQHTPPRAQRDHAAAARIIEEAFDGMPAPGPGEPTLFEAAATESSGTRDVARGRASHCGRWQDLPTSELRDCDWVFPYLSASGLQYYGPAVMLRYLHWKELWSKEPHPALSLGLFDTIGFTFYPPGPEDHDRRDSMRKRLARFTAPQRQGIHRFLEATNDRPEVVAAWARVVAHDAAGSPGPWFDVL